MLRELLARDVELRAPLAQRFREEQGELLRLTSEQAALLARSGKTRRMRVTGCAGSGKTMLALEQARRWRSREDRRVLFVCFNRGLQRHLRELEKDSGIAFWTFHSLCVHLARRAKVRAERVPARRGAAVLLRRRATDRADRRRRRARPAVRCARRRRGAGPADPLAHRADEHAR